MPTLFESIYASAWVVWGSFKYYWFALFALISAIVLIDSFFLGKSVRRKAISGVILAVCAINLCYNTYNVMWRSETYPPPINEEELAQLCEEVAAQKEQGNLKYLLPKYEYDNDRSPWQPPANEIEYFYKGVTVQRIRPRIIPRSEIYYHYTVYDSAESAKLAYEAFGYSWHADEGHVIVNEDYCAVVFPVKFKAYAFDPEQGTYHIKDFRVRILIDDTVIELGESSWSERLFLPKAIKNNKLFDPDYKIR